MSPLETRKQLLIAESEINRAQLLQEWQAAADEVRGLADRARSLGSMASSAASLVAGLIALWRGQSMPAAGKSSWVETVLKGVRLAASIGLAFRARDGKEPK